MEVYERINFLLEKKNLTKRAFAKKLQDLEPRLKSTGEIPTEKTIYKYLNGSIGIRIELVPYIAEVLQVTEQELFTNDKKSRKKYFQNLLKTASYEEIEIVKTRFELRTKEQRPIYTKKPTLENELIPLLPYAPKPLLQNFINKLKELKEFDESI